MRKLFALLMISCLVCTSMPAAQVLSTLVSGFLHDKSRILGSNGPYPLGDRDKRCKSPCSKGSGQVDAGPFWANRGKKDPTYMQDKLFADYSIPRWYIVRKDAAGFAYDPFFITRGKKTITEVKDYIALVKLIHKKEENVTLAASEE